ncbi:MAG: hypothetical protein J6V72_19610 [Kiritimatiellae bacterium]|nr:hypothetical protein [Kiritimatiellia bacterium]
MVAIIPTVLLILVSVLAVFVLVVVILAIVRLPGILRELERGNRQAETVIVSQLNEIIKRLAQLERT